MGNAKNKVVVAGIASILLVAAVVAVAVGVLRNKDVNTSSKAVKAVCSPTDYKDTCEKSLEGADSTDPRELVQVAVKYTINNVAGVIKDSSLLKEAAKDSSTKDAYDVCGEVLGTAKEDLDRSVDKIHNLEPAKANEFVEDLKTWFSAVIANQETCIDAFENTTGDNGEKMKKMLKTSKELSSNALAMTSNIGSLISSLKIDSSDASRRRLLTAEEEEEGWKGRSLLANTKPNAVVAQDGSGKFKTINAAIATIPKKNNVPFVIYVKAGVYREHVEIPKGANKVVMYGDGPLKTVITGKLSFATGTKTFKTSTLAVNSEDFFAHDIGIENTAGAEGHQAVALRVSGDRAVFFNVHINGYQDTLYSHTYRQFYRDCVISGTIDFIFGDALAIFQNCKFVVRRPMDSQSCMVTAQGRIDPRSQGAIVIQNGNIGAEPNFFKAPKPIKAYLGRPWKQLSRTIIMGSYIGGSIAPEGWSPWMGNFALDTLYYAEFNNKGPGSNQAQRVKWKGIQHINSNVALRWTPGRAFVMDGWIRSTGIPYADAMM